MTQADINAGINIAGAVATTVLADQGPEAQLAAQLISQGLAFYQEMQERAILGELTQADLLALQAKVSADLGQLAIDVAAQQ